MESCLCFRQSSFGCKPCKGCGVLYCHSMLQEQSLDVDFGIYVWSWKLSAKNQHWNIKKQELILIIKLSMLYILVSLLTENIFFSKYCFADFAYGFWNKAIENQNQIKATSNNVLHFLQGTWENQTQWWRHSPYSHF